MEKNWSITKLYTQAWEIIKTHKLLWIFGSVVAAFEGLGYNRVNFKDNFPNWNEFYQSRPQSGEQLSQVLGTSTNVLSQILSSIPFYFYTLFLIEVLIAVVFLTVFVVVSRAWAEGLLISGSDEAIKGRDFSIRSSSEVAFRSLTSMIWLIVIPYLLFFLASALGFGLITIGLLSSNPAAKVVSLLILVVALGSFLYWLIFLLLSQVWAARIAVLQKKGGMESLSLGYKLAQKSFWPMLLIAIINTVLTIFVLGVPVVLLSAVFAGGAVALEQNPILGSTFLGIGGLLSLIFVFGLILLNGILTAFKNTVWNLAFEKSKK